MLHAEQYRAGAVQCTACYKIGVPYYYFVNIRHPVIGELYRRWKDEQGLQYAISDVDRLRFEVELLNEETCEKLWEQVTAAEAARGNGA